MKTSLIYSIVLYFFLLLLIYKFGNLCEGPTLNK